MILCAAGVVATALAAAQLAGPGTGYLAPVNAMALFAMALLTAIAADQGLARRWRVEPSTVQAQFLVGRAWDAHRAVLACATSRPELGWVVAHSQRLFHHVETLVDQLDERVLLSERVGRAGAPEHVRKQVGAHASQLLAEGLMHVATLRVAANRVLLSAPGRQLPPAGAASGSAAADARAALRHLGP